MSPVLVFTWEAPNIRTLKGAEWTARHRVYVPQLDPDKWEREFGPWQEGGLGADGSKPATAAYKLPGSVGAGFYKTLHKLGYKIGPSGNYE